VHIADYGDDPNKEINFGHGDNSYRPDKALSAPYWIGAWAENAFKAMQDGTEDERLAEKEFDAGAVDG